MQIIIQQNVKKQYKNSKKIDINFMHFSPINIHQEAKTREVCVDEYPFEEIRGCVFRDDNRYHVGIASHLDEVRKRCTLAHEIGHIDTDTVEGVWTFRKEGRAYRRAREILIPPDSLRELILDGFTDYSSLASLFGVSEKMIALRCQDLSL